jgi:hypothetical protein
MTIGISYRQQNDTFLLVLFFIFRFTSTKIKNIGLSLADAVSFFVGRFFASPGEKTTHKIEYHAAAGCRGADRQALLKSFEAVTNPKLRDTTIRRIKCQSDRKDSLSFLVCIFPLNSPLLRASALRSSRATAQAAARPAHRQSLPGHRSHDYSACCSMML